MMIKTQAGIVVVLVSSIEPNTGWVTVLEMGSTVTKRVDSYYLEADGGWNEIDDANEEALEQEYLQRKQRYQSVAPEDYDDED